MSTVRQLADVGVAFPRSRELLGHDGWSREQLQEHQRTRLAELVRHAKAHSPFYSKLYADLDVRLVPRIEEGRDAAGKFRIIESRP
jgi:phenylacetate-CoA ligase